MVSHQAIGTDDATLANGHTGHDGDVGTEPAVIAHHDGGGFLKSLVALFGRQRMCRSVGAKMWPNEAVLTDPDAASIHEIGSKVDEGVTANMRIPTVVHRERTQDFAVLPKISDQTVQNLIMAWVMRWL